MHSRLPVVIPDRLTPKLLTALTQTRLRPILSLHSNHANEISPALMQRVQPFVAQMPVLNQAVLLRGVNDSAQALVQLSEALFDAGVTPYYLFLLDRVRGASHFEVDETQARALYQQAQGLLPGFLLPRLAREIPHQPSKTLVL